MGYEISTCQMQYDAADKKTDQEDPYIIFLGGKNKTHAKAKKTGSSKLRSKFETLRREIKADVRKLHNSYVNNLVGDVKANPREVYRYINSQKKRHPRYSTPEKEEWKGFAQLDLEKAEEFKYHGSS